MILMLLNSGRLGPNPTSVTEMDSYVGQCSC